MTERTVELAPADPARPPKTVRGGVGGRGHAGDRGGRPGRRGRDDQRVGPVSANPPLVLVSLMAGSYPAELFGRAHSPARFAVTLLAAGQRMLAGRFAAAGRPGAGTCWTTYRTAAARTPAR